MSVSHFLRGCNDRALGGTTVKDARNPFLTRSPRGKRDRGYMPAHPQTAWRSNPSISCRGGRCQSS